MTSGWWGSTCGTAGGVRRRRPMVPANRSPQPERARSSTGSPQHSPESTRWPRPRPSSPLLTPPWPRANGLAHHPDRHDSALVKRGIDVRRSDEWSWAQVGGGMSVASSGDRGLSAGRLVIRRLPSIHDEQGWLAIGREEPELVDALGIRPPVGGVVHGMSQGRLSDGFAWDEVMTVPAGFLGTDAASEQSVHCGYSPGELANPDQRSDVGVSWFTQA